VQQKERDPRAAGEHERIAGRAAIVAAGTLASRLLGLVRDQVIAAIFSRAVTDAFFVAFTLPNLLRQLLGEGAVQSAVLPVLARTKELEGDDAARRFFANLRGLSLTLLTIVTALGIAFAEPLVALFAGGFRGLPGQFERTVTLTRWLFPYIFFMGTAALGMAALNTYRRFTVSAFAPSLLNVAFVIGALWLPALLGARGYDPALALAVAALAGGLLQVIAQWPSLRAIGFAGRARFDFGHPGVGEVLKRMGPVLLGTGVYYVDVLIARRFLSEQGLGAQSYFSWALRLCDFPQGVFVMALQTAALPSMARLAAAEDRAELARTFAFGMRLTLFAAVPATLLAVTLAEPLVVLLFQRGQFDALSAHETARAFVAQGAGIWLVALSRQLVSLYYAVGDTRTPLLVAGIDLGAFVVLAWLLTPVLGHVGVSVAVSGASLVQALLLWALSARHLSDRRGKEIALSFARTGAASLLAALAAWTGLRGLSSLGVPAPGQALIAATLGVLTFLLAATLFGSSELRMLSDPLRRRFGRRRGSSGQP
jgi:putative peptidoglycan lipid II flippase